MNTFTFTRNRKHYIGFFVPGVGWCAIERNLDECPYGWGLVQSKLAGSTLRVLTLKEASGRVTDKATARYDLSTEPCSWRWLCWNHKSAALLIEPPKVCFNIDTKFYQ